MNTPSWSPDGKRIAFTIRIPAGGEFNDDIAVVDLQTLRVDNLTRQQAHDTTPAWSPDGKRIAFASDREGPAEQIYVMNADGTSPRRLTNEPKAGEQPAWSPDGQRIAYTCYRDGNLRVCVMDADGSRVAQLTRGEDFRTGYHPSWSPDGLRIVYRSMWKDSGNLFVMNADGSSPLRLTSAPYGQVTALDLPVWQPVLK